MDKRIKDCPGLTEQDIERLQLIESGLAITADVSRSDVLLCALLSETQVLVLRHRSPKSISSLYRNDATGRIFQPEEQQPVFRALTSGNNGRHHKEALRSGAPIIQNIYPIFSVDTKRVIGAALFEINMIADERHRRRNRSFRQAVRWLQEMCLRGELADTAEMSRFGLYDGVYLVDRNRKLVYMNGTAANMFRSTGIVTDLREQSVGSLEAIDNEMVEEAFLQQKPQETRRESEDGRIWIRKAIPLCMPPASWQNYWHNLPWYGSVARGDSHEVEAVLVLIHNATEAVKRQRELNVKSAFIKEVHHRVKNNLQTIAAILRIQARRAQNDETKQQLTDAVNRVLSMSVIHEFLSQGEHQPINVRDVCQRIANQVAQVVTGPDQSVDIDVSGPNIQLPASQATPAVMVVNELLLNAVEHGINLRSHGRIAVRLADLGDSVELVVEDDGGGLPPDFDLVQSQSLGLQIVNTLVIDDLKGELTMESVPLSVSDDSGDEESAAGTDEPRCGTRVIVTFPKRSLHAA